MTTKSYKASSAYRRGRFGAPAQGLVHRNSRGDLIVASVASDGGRGEDPTRRIAEQIRDALDPSKTPSKVKTLVSMTPAERAEMERLYGGKK